MRTITVLPVLLVGGMSVLLGPAQGKSIPSFAWRAGQRSRTSLLSCHKPQGPFILYGEAFERCDDVEPIAFFRLSHFNPAKPFAAQLVTGNLTIPENIDNQWWVNLRLDVRSNNQWKNGAFYFKFPKNGCNQARINYPKGLLLLNGVSLTGPCLVPAGTTYFNDTPVIFEFPNVRIMPYGHYKVTVNVGKANSDKIIVCQTAEGRIIPKP